MPLYDVRCTACETLATNVVCQWGDYPECVLCGSETAITWQQGQAPTTDVYGSPQWSDAVGGYVSSQREKESIMRKNRFQVCGDRVGGARMEQSRSHALFGHSAAPRRKSSAVKYRKVYSGN